MCPTYRCLQSGGQETSSNSWTALLSGEVMQNNRSTLSAASGDSKLAEQTLLTETDRQRCIESLQRIICDLLIENERLRNTAF